jgi:tetratricopeptide (TPR) repeat protein
VTDEGVVPAAPPALAGPKDGTAAAEPPEIALPPASLPAEYLRRAREEFDAGRVSAAIGILDQFRDRFPAGSDEAWWLYGQLYEANSPRRDIRTALDYYRRLMREYPQSGRCNDARRRIAWLERYYINIQ